MTNARDLHDTGAYACDGVIVPAVRFRPGFLSSCSHRYPVVLLLFTRSGWVKELPVISHARALRHVAVTLSCKYNAVYKNADLYLCV